MTEPPKVAYPRRTWVVPIALTVMFGFGAILYGFSVYATDQAAGAEFSKTTLSLAYGGSVFVGGLLALPVGHFADTHGVRIVVGVGALLGCLGLVGFALSQNTWQVIASWWLLVGPAQAMIYYEPAYVAIDQWSAPKDRARTLATITLIGGLAGIVFIPLTAWLVSLIEWRTSAALLGLSVLVVGGSTALFALPRWNNRAGESGDRTKLRTPVLRDVRFLLYTVALMLLLLSTQGVITHRVARFEEIGFSLTVVAAWAAVASALSLPGRGIAPRLAERFGATRVQASIAVVVAASVVLMVDGTTPAHMIGHFALFGFAFGALIPLRAMVMGGWFSGPQYGRIMGTQWTAVVLTAAAGPFIVGVVRDSTGGYGLPFVVLSVFFVIAAGVILVSGHVQPSPEPAAADLL
ncbi:MAG: MFS transporter [Acidimicrobiia bacterium]